MNELDSKSGAGGAGLKIDAAAAEDVPAVKLIELQTDLSPWSAADLAAETRRDDSFFKVARLDSIVVGFILARLIMFQPTAPGNSTINFTASSGTKHNLRPQNFASAEADIYNIGVSPDHQRRAVGQELIGELFRRLSGTTHFRVNLEVRVSNAKAITFYEKNGFAIVSRRKNFYADPVEDAYLMSLERKAPAAPST